MEVEQYLASEQAVVDLAAALEAKAKPKQPAWDLPAVRDGKSSWYICSSDAWTAVTLIGHGEYDESVEQADYPVRGWLTIVVYFRPEGDRFIVTDLGEAVRALRLKTGCRPSKAADLAADVVHLAGDVMFCESPDWWLTSLRRDGSIGPLPCVPADLPRAICALTLAAYWVSRSKVTP